jgi:hypothetical protein
MQTYEPVQVSVMFASVSRAKLSVIWCAKKQRNNLLECALFVRLKMKANEIIGLLYFFWLRSDISHLWSMYK